MSQLRPLLALRVRMAHRTGTNRWLTLLGFAVAALMVLAVIAGRNVPEDRFFDFVLITPSLFLAFTAVTLFAPLAAGGGNQLYPADNLAAFPVRPSSVFSSSLLLAPLNLAWSVQALVLVAAGSLLSSSDWRLGLALTTVLVFIVLATVTGQALAWWVVGLRARRGGRWASWTVAVLAGVVLLAVIRFGWTTAVLDNAPTRLVADTVVNSAGAYGQWAIGTGAMAVAIVLAYWLGVRATAWTLRRPGDQGGEAAIGSRRVTRRRMPASVRQSLAQIDRASVWRAPALRRGVIVLGVLPALVVLLAGLDWAALVVLPGLVAAGTGLLFGVNAFALDGPGALWLAGQPKWGTAALNTKVRVTAEAVVLASVIAAVLGSIRAPAPANAAEVTAVVGALVANCILVVTRCARYSVTAPFKAELGGRRDTPAPPGAMAAYSLRLAMSTTLTGLLFGVLAVGGVWWVPLAAAGAFALIGYVSWSGTKDQWNEPLQRARVLVTVADG